MLTIRFSVKNLAVIAAVCLGIAMVYAARQVIAISIAGLLMAYMLYPLSERLVRLHIPRAVAALIIILFTVSILCGFVLWIVPTMYKEVETFAVKAPAHVTDWILTHMDLLNERLNMNISPTIMYEKGINTLRESGTTLLNWAWEMLGSMQSALSVLFSTIMVPVIAFFALAAYPKLMDFMDTYVGRSKTQGFRKYTSLFSTVMSQYFRGQFIVMTVLSVLYFVVLKIIGLDTALLLGVISGFLNIVPYLGFVTGITLSVLMAGMQFQDLWHPLYVIIGYGVVQAIDTFFITPKIIGDSLGLHPLATIIVLLISGSIGGLMGMILALPLAAAAFRLYKERCVAGNCELTDSIKGID